VIDHCPLAIIKATADGSATTVTAETLIGIAPSGLPAGHIIKLNPTAALTADNTNFATITFYKRTTGGSQSTIASVTTQTTGSGGTGNWSSYTPISISLTAAVSPGDMVTYAITKANSGVVVPAFVASFAGFQDMAADPDNELSVSLWFGSDAEI
jgi:hypothetical protein